MKTSRETSRKMQNPACLKKKKFFPPKEEDNLNKSSGKNEEMYSWDELKYKANYIHFISNESTERQV